MKLNNVINTAAALYFDSEKKETKQNKRITSVRYYTRHVFTTSYYSTRRTKLNQVAVIMIIIIIIHRTYSLVILLEKTFFRKCVLPTSKGVFIMHENYIIEIARASDGNKIRYYYNTLIFSLHLGTYACTSNTLCYMCL